MAHIVGDDDVRADILRVEACPQHAWREMQPSLQRRHLAGAVGSEREEGSVESMHGTLMEDELADAHVLVAPGASAARPVAARARSRPPAAGQFGRGLTTEDHPNEVSRQNVQATVGIRKRPRPRPTAARAAKASSG